MASSRLRSYLAVALLAAALVALVALLLGPGLRPYLAVDELLQRADEFRGTEVRLAGYLAAAGDPDDDGATVLQVAVRGAALQVRLTERLPPGLEVGAEILLDGTLDDDGTFHAYRLLTQCSSREQEKLQQPHADP